MRKLLSVVALLLLLPMPAYANEVDPSVSSAPDVSVEPTPSPSLEWDQTPIPGSESWGQPPRTLETVYHIPGGPYSPPAEASQGVGGWAVVHPRTGVVHGVIVATIDTYMANNGRMQIEYMGCPAGCLLRFQTRATSDGNVAGWHGPEVTYDKSDQSFNLGHTSQTTEGRTKVSQKLIPSLTATDGMNLWTGVFDIRTEFTSSQINGLAVKLTKLQETFDSEDATVVEFQDWNSFAYESSNEMAQNLNSDIDARLLDQGFDIEAPEEGGFVETIRKLGERVTSIFGGLFNSE